MRWMVEEEWDLEGSEVLPGGEDACGVIWLDIETRKVDAPPGWGYRRRWQTFMVGVAGAMDPGVLFLEVWEGTEQELVDHLLLNFSEYQVRYTATRDFDEMVLRGRFTNARRALAPEPGPWPNLDGADLDWANLRKEMEDPTWERPLDIPSKDVPEAWARGEERLVASHCGKDVIENVLRDPEVELSPSLRTKLIDFVERVSV